jgi:hypothetical protein
VPDVAAALLGDATSNFTAGLLPTSWSVVWLARIIIDTLCP